MGFKKILAATDLSPSADEGLRQASHWAARWKAELTVCHVVPDISVSAPLFPQQHAQLEERMPRMLEAAEASLRRHVRDVTGREDGTFQTAVAQGSPHVGILEEAEEREAELIVVSSAGHSAAGQWLLGSVAEEVVRGARCPVLVVRPSPKSGRILGAVDLSPGSHAVVNAALDVADHLDAQVTLLHALYVEELFATHLGILAGGPAPSPRAGERQQLHALAEARLRTFLPNDDARVRLQVVDGSAAQEIDRAAQQLEAELVVVGTMGLTRVPRFILGSVASKVVRKAPCSVLVVRGR